MDAAGIFQGCHVPPARMSVWLVSECALIELMSVAIVRNRSALRRRACSGCEAWRLGLGVRPRPGVSQTGSNSCTCPCRDMPLAGSPAILCLAASSVLALQGASAEEGWLVMPAIGGGWALVVCVCACVRHCGPGDGWQSASEGLVSPITHNDPASVVVTRPCR